MRVLLADDSVLILERLKQMLGVFRKVEIVGTVKNGTDALTALKTLNPDLAIVDIRMPGLSGLEVISEFRKENKTVKFIILTLFSSDYFRQTAIDAGADYFFNKIDFEKISMLIEELIGKNEELLVPVSVRKTNIKINTEL